jgi:hypothetical protein
LKSGPLWKEAPLNGLGETIFGKFPGIWYGDKTDETPLDLLGSCA